MTPKSIATPRIGAIVLAAGQSSRMGSPKQLAPFDGKPLIRHATEIVLASRARSVAVVLGSSAMRIAPALNGLPVRIAMNQRWPEGMGTSIQAGLDALAEDDLDGVLLTLGDQPLVTSSHLDSLIATQESTGKAVVAAEYAGTVGIPVLFMRSMFAQLRGLAPDKGCKSVIVGNKSEAAFVACPEAECDVDTPEDLAAVQRQ